MTGDDDETYHGLLTLLQKGKSKLGVENRVSSPVAAAGSLLSLLSLFLFGRWKRKPLNLDGSS